jgi:tetratricopeptide (TPR) repeat protein
MSSSTTLTPAQRRTFWVALLAIPLVFFALIEGGLRLGGYGEDTALFAEVEHEGVAYYAINPNVVRRYFGDPDFGTYISRDRFRVEKQPDTYRIFALGASTTVGFPYLFHGSFSSLLRDRLVTQFPERQVEMVNVGITAVNSYAVADLTRELMRYEPDLLLVYAGHNEFYGALGAGSTESMGSRRWVVTTYLALQRFKTVQLIRDGLGAASRAMSGAPEVEDQQLMERMAREREIRHDSRLFQQVRGAFRANMADIIQTAQKHGVDVVVSTLTSNLRDQPPFVPVHSEGTSNEDADRWQELFTSGIGSAEAGDCRTATTHFQQALQIDGGRADGHFHLGRCLEQLGEVEEAAAAYRMARDLDGLRFRASTEVNEEVRTLTLTAGVPLVDMDAAFAEASPNGIVGSELMTEHVHPTFEGYLLMARAFAAAMAEHGLFVPREAWAGAPPPDDDTLRRFAGLTEFDHEVARLRIEQLTNRWPFRAEAIPVVFEPETLAQRFAWNYVRRQIAWGSARNELSRAYAQSGDEERSADEFWALAKVITYDPHYAVIAADMHARGRRFGRAVEMYRFASQIQPQPLTEVKLGGALLEMGDLEAAVVHFERGVALGAGRPLTTQERSQAHLLLARAHIRLGDQEAAQREIGRARALAPNPANAPTTASSPARRP